MMIARTQPANARLTPENQARYPVTRRILEGDDLQRYASSRRTSVSPANLQRYPVTSTLLQDGRPQGPLGARGAAGQPQESTQHTKLVQAAQRLVSHTFYGTLLKQMRQSPFKSDLVTGGRGGEAFTSMLDFQMADHMARGSGRRLTDSIVRHIEDAQNKKQQRLEQPDPDDSLMKNQTWDELSRKARSDVKAAR